jgi:hypothetical protein
MIDMLIVLDIILLAANWLIFIISFVVLSVLSAALIWELLIDMQDYRSAALLFKRPLYMLPYQLRGMLTA